jgi:tetratricopeptide (TPR) repeat protein
LEEAESGDQMPDDTGIPARRLGAKHMLDQFQLYRERFPAKGESSLARHWRYADEAELHGQWFAVQWHLSRILEETQNDVAALRRRSRAYAETQQWERAVADLERIDSQDSSTWPDWQLAGDANRKLKRWSVALANYRRALETNRDSAYLLTGAVDAAAELAEWDAVEEYLRRLAQQHPDSHEILTQLAAVSLHRGDVPAYVENCHRLIEKSAKETNPQIANAVSWTCSLSEQPVAPEAALRLAETARNSDLTSDRYANTLAAALYRLKRYTEAVEVLEQARRMRTTNVFTAAERAFRPPMTQESTAVGRQVPYVDPSGADSLQLYQSSRGSVWDWLYLAMAQFHLGKLDDAKRSLDVAECWFGECGLATEAATRKRAANSEIGPYDLSLIPWSRRLELQILRGQARRLITH